MKEKRYKMYCMNNKHYIIDDADLKKLTENSEKMLVKLKQAIIHPSSIIAIEPYDEKGLRKIDPDTLKVVEEKPKPVADLFLIEENNKQIE